MKAYDSLEERLKMVEMHGDVLGRINTAIKKRNSIEACWLCYACFEGRIVRTLEKLSQGCPEQRCQNNNRVGITTRVECIKRLRKQKYTGLDSFSADVLGQVLSWCRERNTLVHALVKLCNYSGMDKKFLDLALKGQPLAESLYKETTAFRNQYYKLALPPPFPESVVYRCSLLKRKQN